MPKVTKFCTILCLAVIYIVSTTKMSITLNDLLFIIQFMCEILCIVLSIGGFILVYHNMYTPINNKANYMAITSLEYCVLIIIGMKCYFFPDGNAQMGEQALYMLVLECFQISMPVIAIKYINETTNLKKWSIVQLGIVAVVIILMWGASNKIEVLFRDYNVQIIARGILIIVTGILLLACIRSTNKDYEFQTKILIRLIKIKIVISILEIIRIVTGIYWGIMFQYILQIIFMAEVVIDIDEFTIGHTWAMVEHGVKSKRHQIDRGKDEQKVLVIAAKEIEHYITKIVEQVDHLEKVLQGKEQKYIEKVKSNSYRLLSLNKHILESNEDELNSKKTTFKQIDLGEYIRNVISSIDPYIQQKGIRLEYCVSKNPIIADVNPEDIERIVFNLISNAVKYNEKDGKIQVTLAERRNYVYLCIKDSGIGISSEDLKTVFEKFKRVESNNINQQEGSGLGLTIVKSLVERHNGHIRVVSSEGRGTVISIEIPLTHQEME